MTRSPPPYATCAVVLRRFDFGETSQVGHLYTLEAGRVSVLAKGVKRPGAELKGPLDLFALADVEIRPRPRSSLHLMTRYRVRTGYPGLRRNLERLMGAFYVTDLLREGTRDGDPDPHLFSATTSVLAALGEASRQGSALLIAWYALTYLRLGGFLPRFDACVLCERDAPLSGPVRLAPSLGGLVCRACARQQARHLVTLAPPFRDALRGLLQAPSAEAVSTLAVPAATRLRLNEYLRDQVQRVLEKELRSAPFVAP